MRLLLGLLLATLCISSGRATDRTAWLSSLAGVPIRIFELQAPDVSGQFRAFLSQVPMTNDRPVPGALIDDTVASLSFLKSATPAGEPSYFVASYLQKTPLVELSPASRQRYLERYGEAVYPQQVCPVFLDSAGASAATLLSTAVNLPSRYFSHVTGSPANFDRLFGLHEVSHCGFIARTLADPTMLPPALDRHGLRTVLEALGDFEAIAVYRGEKPAQAQADEADVLFASRLLATFLVNRYNPYTPIPALLHEYQRIGIDATHRQLDRITDSVNLARRTVRSVLAEGPSGLDTARLSLAEIQALLLEARTGGELAVEDALAGQLIADLQSALRLLQGDTSASIVPLPQTPAPGIGLVRQPLITLNGTAIFASQ
ncbi:MAG TPA: hypothetical protein VFG91_06110 [Woeseiaceae bacterium]|nr:hypothetical protein [Woeseiaceae bacterium]